MSKSIDELREFLEGERAHAITLVNTCRGLARRYGDLVIAEHHHQTHVCKMDRLLGTLADLEKRAGK